MRAHTDQEIIEKASAIEKLETEIKEGKIDIAVDMEDESGTAHTYVVTFQQVNNTDNWTVYGISELSSL